MDDRQLIAGVIMDEKRRKEFEDEFDHAPWTTFSHVLDLLEAAEHRYLVAEMEADRLRHNVPVEGDFVCPDSLRADAAEAEAKVLRNALRLLVKDLDDLASESSGVAGLHKDGDVAEWDWLRDDGNWLEHWDAARAALEGDR